jgi:hypothetical protein
MTINTPDTSKRKEHARAGESDERREKDAVVIDKQTSRWLTISVASAVAESTIDPRVQRNVQDVSVQVGEILWRIPHVPLRDRAPASVRHAGKLSNRAWITNIFTIRQRSGKTPRKFIDPLPQTKPFFVFLSLTKF